jgi:hypothetical protein
MKIFANRLLVVFGLLLILISPLMTTSSLAAEDFTIIVLPDTQNYSCGADCSSDPAIFKAQTKWIVDNKDVLNIVYVAHEGDIVERGANKSEWENASAAMSLLEDPVTTGLKDGIPYGVVPGNHDLLLRIEPRDHVHVNFETYFGVARFKDRSYYGGHYEENNRSNYTLFKAGEMEFIVINLDYAPGPDIIDWADAMLKRHSNRRAIVVSHHILSHHTMGGNDFEFPSIYEALKDNPNLFLMLCGHVGGEERRTDTFNGNNIHTLLADYQWEPNGGDGWLRILEFSPVKNEIRVRTYSPTLDENQTDADSQFTLKYDMGGVKSQR